MVTHIICTIGSQDHTLLPDRGQRAALSKPAGQWWMALWTIPSSSPDLSSAQGKVTAFRAWDSPKGRGTWARCQSPKPWAAGWQGPGYCAASLAPWTWAASQSPPLWGEKNTTGDWAPTPILCSHHDRITPISSLNYHIWILDRCSKIISIPKMIFLQLLYYIIFI